MRTGFDFVINNAIKNVEDGIRTLISFGFSKKDVKELVRMIFEEIDKEKSVGRRNCNTLENNPKKT